ncbi:MAG: hypothetical protein IJ774_03915, partial [Selenomonadaceae bacterium]|nr:hypothetical protein [Selenomonadaceae bacterium]
MNSCEQLARDTGHGTSLNSLTPRKIFFVTLGCKVNQYESEAMQKLFEAAGYVAADDISDADVVVVNTCTVTAVSSQKSRQMIRRAAGANKNSIVAVVGCYAQSEPEVVAAIDGVDVVIGTKDRTRIVELVETASKVVSCQRSLVNEEASTDNCPLNTKHYPLTVVGSVDEIHAFEELPHAPQRTRAFLKIEDGCNNFCAYCIIP